MCHLMSEAIFMQDGAPVHTAKRLKPGFPYIIQGTG